MSDTRGQLPGLAPAIPFASALSAAPVQPPADFNPRPLLDKYCVTCHSERLKTGGLILEKIDTAHLGEHAEIWEKVAEKLHGGMMPPAGLPRPDKSALDNLATWAETEL